MHAPAVKRLDVGSAAIVLLAMVLISPTGCRPGDKESSSTPLTGTAAQKRADESPGPAKADPNKPDPDVVLGTIPVLTDASEELESLILHLDLLPPGASGYRVEMAWVRGGGCAMKVIGRRGVPLLIVAQGRMLVFDSMNQTVMGLPTTLKPMVRVVAHNGNAQVRFGIADPQGGEPNIELDVPSFFRGSEDRMWAVRRDGIDQLRTTTARGSVITAMLTPGENFPCRQLSIRTKQESTPGVSIEIQPNVEIDPEKFTLPDLDALKTAVKFEERDSAEGWSDGGTFVGPVVRQLIVRDALGDPRAQGRVEQGFKRKIDWAALREFDARISEIVVGPAKTQ